MAKGLMDQARKQLRLWIEGAAAEAHVASVASLSAAAGDLSTAATVAVLKEAIDDGWIFSTRGPDGGYWRTDKRTLPGLNEALDDLERHLKATLGSVHAVRAAIASQP